MKFRKKPVVIDAVQWTGANADDVLGFTLGRASVRDESFQRLSASERVLVIETLEGAMRAEPGDWIICGVKGEFYPCKPEIFALTYEPAHALPPSSPAQKAAVYDQSALGQEIRGLVAALSDRTMADITLDTLIKMARCAHVNRAGGNDYLLCNDCGLMWDYRKESANDGLVNYLKLLPPSSPVADSPTSGVQLIAAERQRQMADEGWTPEHDDSHGKAELVAAALCYASCAAQQTRGQKVALGNILAHWPWESSWWKPSDDPIRNLVKAGALIAAEIERLNSAAAVASPREPVRASDRAEDLWETIGNCVCCQEHVGHWCEGCQRALQLIREALSPTGDAERGKTHGQDTSIGCRADCSGDPATDAVDREVVSTPAESPDLQNHRAGLRARPDQFAPTPCPTGAIRPDAAGRVRPDVAQERAAFNAGLSYGVHYLGWTADHAWTDYCANAIPPSSPVADSGELRWRVDRMIADTEHQMTLGTPLEREFYRGWNAAYHNVRAMLIELSAPSPSAGAVKEHKP